MYLLTSICQRNILVSLTTAPLVDWFVGLFSPSVFPRKTRFLSIRWTGQIANGHLTQNAHFCTRLSAVSEATVWTPLSQWVEISVLLIWADDYGWPRYTRNSVIRLNVICHFIYISLWMSFAIHCTWWYRVNLLFITRCKHWNNARQTTCSFTISHSTVRHSLTNNLNNWISH